jgi:3-oxoacyl-[acyl-carrier-protein] synthase II
MSKKRVVVTGLGLVTPVGNTVQESWANILAGKSGIKPITHFDCEPFPVKIAGTVTDFDISEYISPKESRKMDQFIHYGLAAGLQAYKDSGLQITDDNAERIGVMIGSGIGGIASIEDTHSAYLKSGPKKVTPFFVPKSIINMISGHFSIMTGAKGPNLAIVTACTTGTHSIGVAARTIAYGDADVMIAGGAEGSSSELGMAGFAAARALSTRNDAPEKASRPWDKNRDGFVLGDGAGVMVLESLEHAQARGAKIYAELVGFGMSGDAYHMTLPESSGDGARRSMRNALQDAGMEPSEVDYINAHGTSTPAGDKLESDAVKACFGDHAYKLAVSSTKSMTGHLLGAAGGIEAVFSVLAIKDQVAPPTINLDDPEEGCDLNYVAHKAQKMPINVALSNSFGFGGTNGSLIFKKI